ncbi:2,5-didehydrogluconate reductase [Lactobacillus selangorensis]|uniref:2,5-didehydrogluconate reductase n=1 Tax=Lactobacillus selangorensis TaxID=81857 RepID=A0A0R2G8K9_9LACO|nr:aldo/keto reductase [Lactobacillus selangorensis]KRN28681.1 2,5-didehydrogluconate reductase [Lactobacillus selangorensis]KRN32909.1 2,5-didehydrogluconate reductase [Lactobacillus selangorensis]
MFEHAIQLNDGNSIPAIGFGAMIEPKDTYQAVLDALKNGYRHIDTAASYFNEKEVGQAIKDSGIPREELFVTSKLWIQDYGYEAAQKGLDTSLKNLGLDYLDLYLLHQPYDDVIGAWRGLEKAQKDGKVRSIGVSNMNPNLWKKFIPQFSETPAVNQVEFNPLFQQKELRKLMDQDKVRLEAWYPLGHGNQELLTNPKLETIAKKYGKNVGQVIIRFEYQDGVITLPKSSHPERIKTNLNVFDFQLTPDEMKTIEALDTGKGTFDPESASSEKYLREHLDVHQNG